MKNNRGIILLIIILFGVHFSYAQQDTFYKHMEGQINSTINLVADLVRIDGNINGSYYYYYHDITDEIDNVHYGKTMPVNGTIDNLNNIQFQEFNLNGDGAVYQGILQADNSISGVWQNSEGTRVLPFELVETYPTGSIAFNVYYLKESHPLSEKDNESPAALIEMTLLLPGIFENTQAVDSVKRIIMYNFFGERNLKDSPLELMDHERDVYFKTFVKSNEELYEGNNSFSWEKKKIVNVHYNENYLLALECFDYGFTGGAHGMPVSKFDVIDLKNGTTITLGDIFREEYLNDLRDILNSELRKKYALEPKTSLKEAGFFYHAIDPSDNFYITKDGMGFYYNRYEVAPYAMGSTDIFIPYNRLKRIMKGDTPVSKLLNK